MTIEWNRALITLGIVTALAAPSAALARDGGGRHGADDQTQHGTDSTRTQEHATHHSAPSAGGPVRTERYELRGKVAGVDAGAGTITVAVKKANHGRRGARLRQQTVQFDVSSARIIVHDVNGDGARDLKDVVADDAVRVQADLPRTGAIDLTQTFAARMVQDRARR
jgi:hypothetical protein